jgi:hypothetical protein
MDEVLLLDSGEGQALGHYSEDLKSAFRSTYSLFDKIGLFLNDYFQIGLAPGEVNFRKVWSEKSSGGAAQVRPTFAGRRNWPLRRRWRRSCRRPGYRPGAAAHSWRYSPSRAPSCRCFHWCRRRMSLKVKQVTVNPPALKPSGEPGLGLGQG